MNKLLTSTFIFGGIAAASIMSAPATHATTQSCVDGTINQNLTASITKDYNTVTVATKSGAPLCKDLTLNWDSYTMPDTYDGTGFSSKTATPQTQFDHHVIVMKAGEHTATATLKQPTCKNVQVDLYYGAEIVTVTAAGHGAQFINGGINGDLGLNTKRDLAACQTPVTPVTPTTPTTPTTPETPATPETPVTPTTPETSVTPAVTELPSTGIRENMTVLMGAVLAAGAYAATFAINKKRA